MNRILKKALQNMSPDIAHLVKRTWCDYKNALAIHNTNMPTHNDFIPSLCTVWASSNFIINNCIRHPTVILDLFESGDMLLEYANGEYIRKLKKSLLKAKDHRTLLKTLREFRRREMIRIAWRDLAKWTTSTKTINDLSVLADSCIMLTNELLYQWLSKKCGTPINSANGNPQSLFVLAMGKLGADELNFSSDVDLIYCYPHNGELTNGMTYEKFFLRLAQQLTTTLSKITADGFVFRVDLRLRPYGTSGAVVNTFSAIENYYRDCGRDWERYALVKARIINNDKTVAKKLLYEIRQFVYRDYLDYSAIEALRKLQIMIHQEVRKHGLENNIKRGTGGIREIEFISQTHKIIRGGRQFRLQIGNTLNSLILLRETGCLDETATEELSTAYKFLRNLENHLQMFDDQQTHDLPIDSIHQQRIAYSMGFSNWKSFTTQLDKQRTIVHYYLKSLIAQPHLEFSEKRNRDLEQQMQKLWHQNITNDEATDLLNTAGYTDIKESLRLISSLKNYIDQQQPNQITLSHLQRLMPHLLTIIGRSRNADIALRHIIPLIETIVKNHVYLVLLLENPIILSQAVSLCAISPWIANQLAHYPLLLDELLDPKTLFAPPTLKKLKQLLQQQLNSIPEDEIELQLEAVRWFKQAHVLRVAAADITGLLPLMRISDYLTDIASVVLDKVRELALQELVKEHGAPSLTKNYKQSGFSIIAYGKLGGIELGYNSDLDLIFLHPTIDLQMLTTGKAPLTNERFYSRLGKRIIQILNQPHASGFLYKIDLRLRPSGNSGLLVNSIAAFAKYQQTEAWYWEHQALVRARPLIGETTINHEFEKIRLEILRRARAAGALRSGIIEMRQKMRTANEKCDIGFFDLKQGQGGLIDIEFISQYAVLHWGHTHPSLLEYPDNVRILERLGMEGLMSIDDVNLLTEAYKAYRAYLHQAALQNQSDLVNINNFQFFRVSVCRIWQQLFNTESKSHDKMLTTPSPRELV